MAYSNPEKQKAWREKNKEYIKEYAKKYRLENKDKIRAFEKKRDVNKKKQYNKTSYERRKLTQDNSAIHLKRRYGLSKEDKERMYNKQNGCCAICGKPLFINAKALHIDHCHTTGQIRGLLCRACNHGLGNFEDNTISLSRAIQYLNYWKMSPEERIKRDEEEACRVD